MELSEKYCKLFEDLNNHYGQSGEVKSSEWLSAKEDELNTRLPICLKEYLKQIKPNYYSSQFEFDLHLTNNDSLNNYYVVASAIDGEKLFLLEKSNSEIIDSPVYFLNENELPEMIFESLYDWFMASIGKNKDLNDIQMPDEYWDLIDYSDYYGFMVKSKLWIDETEKKTGTKFPLLLKAILLKFDSIHFESDYIQYGHYIRDIELEDFPNYYVIAMNDDNEYLVLEKSTKESLDCSEDCTVDLIYDGKIGEMYGSIQEMIEL